MRNSSGDMIANTMEGIGAHFVFGSGEILPVFEDALDGLRIGARKTFSVSGDDAPGLLGIFHFEVVIDDIIWTKDLPKTIGKPRTEFPFCGADCSCRIS
jgi:hypothetical protein